MNRDAVYRMMIAHADWTSQLFLAQKLRGNNTGVSYINFLHIYLFWIDNRMQFIYIFTDHNTVISIYIRQEMFDEALAVLVVQVCAYLIKLSVKSYRLTLNYSTNTVQ
jgi:hypothetical protein